LFDFSPEELKQQRFEPRAQKCVVDCRTQCMAF